MASSYGEDASKQALRSAYLDIPKLSPSHQARVDGDVIAHLCSFGPFREAELVLAFPSQREECDVFAAVKKALGMGKRVALVDVAPSGVAHYVDATDGVTPMCFDEAELAASICLVPGLVFDAEGYRVAYGAGYIDNFLTTYEGLSISPVRAIQVSSNPLPRDPHDVPVDVLVSDAAVWRCRH